MPSSGKRGLKPRANVALIVVTFFTGVALAPIAWWQKDPLIVALAALIPFALHLRHGGE